MGILLESLTALVGIVQAGAWRNGPLIQGKKRDSGDPGRNGARRREDLFLLLFIFVSCEDFFLAFIQPRDFISLIVWEGKVYYHYHTATYFI